MIEERFRLAYDRLMEIQEEYVVQEPFASYFKTVAGFLEKMFVLYRDMEEKDWERTSLSFLQRQNRDLFQDILEPNYEKSYANPAYAAKSIGKEYAGSLCFLYTEMRSLIPFAFEQNLLDMVIRIELFLEIYHAFYASYEEVGSEPKEKEIRQIIYWFISDYSEVETEKRLQEQINPERQFATEIIINSDLSDIKYLYRFGEYITENEIKMALYLNTLPEKTIAKMADTFTEGYRMGFINGNKDLSKKKTVNIRYSLGFERVIKRAVMNFGKMGLNPTIYRAGVTAFFKKGTMKIGYYGAIANKQYEYDHKDDEALFLDRRLINRKLEVLKETYEENKELASLHAGPACMEVFGEKPFAPVPKKENLEFTEEQQQLLVEYASKSGQIVNDYIKGEERSFTIIAFPTPEIGENFEAVFEEVIRINTLDYKLYEEIQQTIIDTLDQAECVLIKGKDGNKTDLKVSIQKVADPLKETAFENCVADVNIPVGEVFTSPVLEGTNGILHVKQVYLNELKYKNLELCFKNGKIEKYSCDNFETEEENKKYIRNNVLFHHETLPMGEFAIGTNTTAYVTCRKYALEEKLPILIAEKMGPHFAVGDTCYSHCEEVKVCNPNGKEIIAKDNEISLLRKTDIAHAYFNCHTDITIPYDDLEGIYAVMEDGSNVPIIKNGRFLLEGTEKLNEPFSNY